MNNNEEDDNSIGTSEEEVEESFQPYSFDPIIENSEIRDDDDEYSTDSSDSENPRHENDENTGIDSSEFCTCGNCIRMTKYNECVCCKSELLPLIQEKYGDRVEYRRINGGNEEVVFNQNCIIDHPTLRNMIRDPIAIKMHLIRLSFQNPRTFPHEPVSDTKYRYGAYRLTTLFIHGILGKGNRKVLPSCIVNFIRLLYPNCDNDYTGFKEFDE